MRSLGMRSLGMTVRARPQRCGGVMARLAVAHLIVAGIDPAPLLREAGLTVVHRSRQSTLKLPPIARSPC